MKKNTLFIGFSVFAIGLSSCANIAKNEKTSDVISTIVSKGLSAQELTSGECGIFLWDNAVPRTFVFFHKQGEISAKYYAQGIENTLRTEQNTTEMAYNGAINLTFSNTEFETVVLKGVLSEMLKEGQQISSATLTTQKADAWEKIHPVSGVYVCR